MHSENTTIAAAKRLRSHLDYNPSTGAFTWIVPTNGRVKPGQKAGRINRLGYVHFMFEKKMQLAHRLAWLYVHGEWPANQIDHVNGNKSDNRIENLREASGHENMQNRLTIRRDNKSGMTGVRWAKERSKWRATIQVNGKSKHLGMFDSQQEAHKAYLDAKSILHPFSYRNEHVSS